MQEMIEDLRAALDQMNRSLKVIADNSQKTIDLLEKMNSEKTAE